MTTLTITPNYEKKRLKLSGTVAAGEHVAVTVAGGWAWASATGAALRLRVVYYGKLLAEFPRRDAEEPDAWMESGEDATCELNLNTIPASKWLVAGGNCLWVLDDPELDTLYGVGELDVMPWHRAPGGEVPYDLDGYPDFVEEAKAAIAEAARAASSAEAAAVAARDSATESQNSAAESARVAGESAAAAQSQANVARNAATDAQSAQTAAEAAQASAAGSANEAAEEASLATRAAIAKMRERTGDRLWHNVALSQNARGQWVMDVDQNAGDDGGLFDAEVKAIGTTAARSLAARAADVINVKDYGAVGDGVADDTAAIQAAIDAARTRATGRDTVFFPNGRFRTTEAVTITDKAIVLQGAYIVMDNPEADAAIIVNTAFSGTIIENCYIQSYNCGIWLQRGGNAVVQNATIFILNDGVDNSDVGEGRDMNDTISNPLATGIRLQNTVGEYVGSARIWNCYVRANHWIDGIGVLIAADDSDLRDVTTVNFKIGIRNGSSNNYYARVHSWINQKQIPLSALDGDKAKNYFEHSCTFMTYKDLHLVDCYSDGMHHAVFSTQGMSEGNELVISGLRYQMMFVKDEGAGRQLPTQLTPVVIYSPHGTFNFANIRMKGLIVNTDAANKIQVFNKSNIVLPGFWENNPNSNMLALAPIKSSAIVGNVETGQVARLYGKDGAYAGVGWFGVGKYSTGGPYVRLNVDELTVGEGTENETTYPQTVLTLSNNNTYMPNAIPNLTGTFDLGSSNRKWNNIYAVTNQITTSDERLKTEIAAVDDAVLDAWGDVGFATFRMAAAVAQKGGEARIHAGLIAQRVKAAFEAHGLDPFRYGLLCHDEWLDEYEDVADDNGNTTGSRIAIPAGDVYSLRYEETLCVEAAYQRRRADRMEARLAALERAVGTSAAQGGEEA